jgi:hypothetical protein
MLASLSPPSSGNISSSNHLLVTGALGIAELHYAHIERFERGSSRPSGATLTRFAHRDLLRQFQEVEQLPDEDKLVIKKLLDAFLIRKLLQALAR